MGGRTTFGRAAVVVAATAVGLLTLTPAASAQVLGVPLPTVPAPVPVTVPPLGLLPVVPVSVPAVDVVPAPVIPAPVVPGPVVVGPIVVAPPSVVPLVPVPELPADPVREVTGVLSSPSDALIAPEASGSGAATVDQATDGVLQGLGNDGLERGPVRLRATARAGAGAQRSVDTNAAAVTGALQHPGTSGRWASLGSAAARVAPWLALLAVALVLQAVARSAWRERARAAAR